MATWPRWPSMAGRGGAVRAWSSAVTTTSIAPRPRCSVAAKRQEPHPTPRPPPGPQRAGRQRLPLILEHLHDELAEARGQDVLRPHLDHAGAKGPRGGEQGPEVEVVREQEGP